MILDALKKFDPVTANGVLAAAALATTTDTGLGEADVVKKYRQEANEVIAEIWRRLNLPKGPTRPSEKARFDEVLAKAIHDVVFSVTSSDDALARAGQAGRLPPGLYKVEQPEKFRNTFYNHGFQKKTIESIINQPDDFQHLMVEEAEEPDVISLFMKRYEAASKEAHWMLVQTLRQGITQVAQSAWRVYPKDVDLVGAKCPLDVLKAFANVYGTTVRFKDSRETKFIESESFEGRPDIAVTEFLFRAPDHGRWFASISRVKTLVPGKFNVGIAYCIDMKAYEEALRRRLFNV